MPEHRQSRSTRGLERHGHGIGKGSGKAEDTTHERDQRQWPGRCRAQKGQQDASDPQWAPALNATGRSRPPMPVTARKRRTLPSAAIEKTYSSPVPRGYQDKRGVLGLDSSKGENLPERMVESDINLVFTLNGINLTWRPWSRVVAAQE